MKENSLFVEKYRSKTLDEYVGNEQLKQIVAQYIEKNDLQNESTKVTRRKNTK